MSWNKLLQHPFTLKGVDGQDVAASLGSLMEARLENVGATLRLQRLQRLHVEFAFCLPLLFARILRRINGMSKLLPTTSRLAATCSHLLPLVRSSR